MKKAVDFEALRRKRRRSRRFRQLLLLCGVALLVLLGVYLGDLLMQSDLTTKMSDIAGSFGGADYPVPLPGGVIRDVDAMGSNLTVLNDTNLYIYNKKGKQISNLQQMTDKTVALPAGGRVLAYDYGGRKVSLYSTSKTLTTHQFTDDMVIGADLGEGGEYAIVTSPRHYIAKVTAYNSKFQPMMNWYSTDQFVLHVSIAPKGGVMAIAALDGDEGVLRSELYFLRFGLEKEVARVPLEDELIVWMDYQTEYRLAVLTERAYRVYDNTGKLVSEYRLPEAPLIAFQSDGERMLLACATEGTGSATLIVLDFFGKEAARASVGGKFVDLALTSREAYILTDAGITRYDSSLKPVQTIALYNLQRIQYVDGRLYYITQDEICVLQRE